jgi:hypothetical protein
MPGPFFTHVQVRLPPHAWGRSHKWIWATEHVKFTAQNENDASNLFVYCDGSRYVDNGVAKTGYGVFGYSGGRVVFERKGAMGNVESSEGEMKGLRKAVAATATTIEAPNATRQPTGIFMYSDDDTSIQRIVEPMPRIGRQYSKGFQEDKGRLLCTWQHTDVVIS